jgi:hypothetical protein
MANRFPKQNIARAGVTIASTSISTATTTAQATSTDTLDGDEVIFNIDVSARTNGTVSVAVNEADASNMSGETAVPASKIKYYRYDSTGAPLSSASSLAVVGRLAVGVINSKRYVTCDIVTTGTVTLTAQATVEVVSSISPQN